MLISENKIRKIVRRVLLAENKKPEGFDTSLSKDPKIEKIIRRHAGGLRGITGNPIYQKSKGKSKNPGVSGQITSTLDKLRKKGFDLSVADLRNKKDYSLNIDALELYFKYYNKIVKEKPKTKPKEAEKYAFRNMLNKLKIDAKSKKTDKTDKGGAGAPDSDSSSGTSGSSSGSGSRKTTPKKSSSGRKSVSEIQKSLNKLKEKGFINGDYQKKKLAVDGKWGARTRSATSKFLKLFEKEKIRSALGINKEVNDLDELVVTGPTKKPGPWGDVTVNISGQIGIEGNKNKYDSLNALLTKFLGTAGLEPVAGGGEGETESIFTAYKAARVNAKIYQNESPWVSKEIINPGKASNSLKTEIDGKFEINPLGIDKIKFEFPCKNKNHSITFSYFAKNNEDLSSAKVKILEMSESLKYAEDDFPNAPKIKGKELSLSEWKRFGSERLLNPNTSPIGWYIGGDNFASLISFAVRIALLEKGRAANREAGGDGSVKSFLGTGKEKKTSTGSTGSTGSAGGSQTPPVDKTPPAAAKKYGDELKKNAPKKMINLLMIGKGNYKDVDSTRAGTTTWESQRYNITDSKFKNVELSSPDWAGKSKGSYMLATTWRHKDSTACELYFYEPKGWLTLDGPQFWNYRIGEYTKLSDGTLVPKDSVENAKEDF